MKRARESALLLTALVGLFLALRCAGDTFLQPRTVVNPAPPTSLGHPASYSISSPTRFVTVDGSSTRSTFRSVLVALAALTAATIGKTRHKIENRNQSLVACRVKSGFPHKRRAKQKVLRRLSPYGAIPSWTTLPLFKKKLIQLWRKNPVRPMSMWGRRFMEKQRVRFHYNMKAYQMKAYLIDAKKKGNYWPLDRFFVKVESRLSNVLWRVGLVPTMAAAHTFLLHAHVETKRKHRKAFNWAVTAHPCMHMQVGDVFRVRGKIASQKLGRKLMEAEGNVDIPPHIKWDKEKMEGEILGPCAFSDVGIPVNVHEFAGAFSGPNLNVRMEHVRWYPGTHIKIKKTYNGGRPVRTPENVINMKRGRGLNTKGKKRPPCLWGRKQQLNNPYEVSKYNRPPPAL